MKRLWIPLVLFGVVVIWGFSVSRIHGIFGSAQQPSYADAQGAGTKPGNAKQLVYQVFGPPGTVADISYFDADSDPQWVAQAHLPWSVTFTAASAGIIGNLAAQGDSDSIGCRIVIDGEVKDERISNEVNAFTYCLLTAA
ncbi:MAG TPA: MmpS family protein [Mycobacterium sp.]|nr:MmpS family protein [Mycobacterium sp.]